MLQCSSIVLLRQASTLRTHQRPTQPLLQYPLHHHPHTTRSPSRAVRELDHSIHSNRGASIPLLLTLFVLFTRISIRLPMPSSDSTQALFHSPLSTGTKFLTHCRNGSRTCRSSKSRPRSQRPGLRSWTSLGRDDIPSLQPRRQP